MKIRTRLMILCLALALASAGCSRTGAEAPTATVHAIPVRTATVETRDLAETLSLTGTLDPRAEVIVVPEVTARVMRVLRNEGDTVARGQLLAVLDQADFTLAAIARRRTSIWATRTWHTRAPKENGLTPC